MSIDHPRDVGGALTDDAPIPEATGIEMNTRQTIIPPDMLPGRWDLQAITQLFKENRFCKGEFIGLGRKLDLKNIVCPTCLLAGAAEITMSEQVMIAAKLIGTHADKIVSRIAPGGHVGLFMGERTLKETWPEIGRWIVQQQ